MINGIELFSGSGTLTKIFNDAGHNVISVDNRYRKGTCEPLLHKNIMDVRPGDFPFKNLHFAWCATPCPAFSYASGNYYFENGMYKESARIFLDLFKKSIELIEKCAPVFYFIENPRGRLRYLPEMIEFLERTNGVCRTITLSSYGHSTTKPTNIFTNALDWQPRPMDKYGRGAKCNQVFNNLTTCQRQKLPSSLAVDILNFMENVPGALIKYPVHKEQDSLLKDRHSFYKGPGTLQKVS